MERTFIIFVFDSPDDCACWDCTQNGDGPATLLAVTAAGPEEFSEKVKAALADYPMAGAVEAMAL